MEKRIIKLIKSLNRVNTNKKHVHPIKEKKENRDEELDDYNPKGNWTYL